MKKYFILSSFPLTASFLILSLMTASAASAPAVKTAPALNITYSSAILYGGVDPEGSATATWFEYGTQSGVYDFKTPYEIISNPSIANYSIGSLSSNNTYYFRLAAKNINGVSYGTELSFKTLLAPPAPPMASSEPTASFIYPSGSLPSSSSSSNNYQSSSMSSNFSSISSLPAISSSSSNYPTFYSSSPASSSSSSNSSSQSSIFSSTSSVSSASSILTSTAESSSVSQSSSSQSALRPDVSFMFARKIIRGSVGEDVRNLQILLAKDKSIYPEGLITGAYGPLTEKAVKRLQAKYNLPQVGEIGPLTKFILQSMAQSSISTSTMSAKILKSSPVSGFFKVTSMPMAQRSAVAKLLVAKGIPLPFSGGLSAKNNYLASPLGAKKIKLAESQPPLLSLDFDSGLDGTNGEAPTRSDGTDTIDGLDGKGVDLSAKSNLAYSNGSDNFNKDSGTFELWFRPHTWSTDGQVIHRFLDARFNCPTSGCLNYMLLDVDNYDKKIIFKIDDAQTPWDINGSGEKQSVYNFSQISQWQWHHLAVSWDKQTGSKMYFDGKLVSSNSQPFSFLGNPIGDIIFSTSENNQLVGNMSPGSYVDFLNIYGYPKTSDEIAADYSALKDPIFTFKTDDANLGFKISGKMLDKFPDHQDANVAGQDGGLSIPYDGKSFWLFDDTNLINGNFTNNNIALDKAVDFSNLSLGYKKDAQGSALPILTPQSGEDLIWPAAMFNNNGVIYTYYDAIKMDEATWFYGLGQGWAKSTAPITDINKTEFVRTGAYWPSKGKTWINDGPGYPVYDDGNYVYMTQSFGKKDDGITVVQPGAFMTRVRKSEVENIAAHEYWDGSNWTKDKTQKVNIFPAPYNESIFGNTVGWNSYLGKYLMVHAAGPSLNLIAVRVSDSITGPWSQAKIIADCDKSQNNFLPCYAVEYHPEYDKNGGQTIYLSTANWQRYYLYGMEVNLQKVKEKEVSLLWNPGPKYKSVIVFASEPNNPNSCSLWGSSLEEGALVGNPANGCIVGTKCDDISLVSQNRSCESSYIDTRVGWAKSDLNKYPGWSIWNLGGGNGSVVEYQFLNHGLTLPKTKNCQTHEIGLVYHNWFDPTGDKYNFKINSDGSYFRLGQFSRVEGRFNVALVSEKGPPQCDSFPTAEVRADFRVAYRNKNGTEARSDLLGLIVYSMTSHPLKETIIFDNGCSQTSTHCQKDVLDFSLAPQLLPDGKYHSYAIDYKGLLKKYMPLPPAGFSLDDAEVAGFDVYSEQRGADLDFKLKGSAIVGII